VTEQEKTNLIHKEHEAGVMREFCRHPGFQLLKAELETRIADARHSWLKAPTPADAEAIRLRASAYEEVYSFLKSKILAGDVATQRLAGERNAEPSQG